MSFLQALVRGMVFYSFHAFILFSLVISICSGFADVTFYSRRVASQEEWMREAIEKGEDFVEIDYTPNLITGIASFVMFAVSTVTAIFFFMKKFDSRIHILIIAVTVLAAFIFFLPRPPLGTGTENMKEVFAFLMLLGIIDSSLFNTYIRKDSSQDEPSVRL